MPLFKFSTHLEQSLNGEDALFAAEIGTTVWFCIADGAGGTGSGLQATGQLVETFKRFIQNASEPSADDFEAFLRRCDRDLFLSSLGGETTAVVGWVNNSCVVGASVGDSEAWLFNREYDYP